MDSAQGQPASLLLHVGGEAPPAFTDHLLIAHAQPMAGFQHVHVLHQGGRGVHGLVAQVVHQGIGVHAAGHQAGSQQGPHFRSEGEVLVATVVVQGFDAQAITGDEELLRVLVQHREGEHAFQARQAGRAPMQVGRQEHLGIRVGAEGIRNRGALQLGTQRTVVVDLAVEGDHVAAIGRAEGLVSAGTEVDDAEAAMAQHGIATNVHTSGIRTAMGHGIGHALHPLGGSAQALQPVDACYAAHVWLRSLPVVVKPSQAWWPGCVPGPCAGAAVRDRAMHACGSRQACGGSCRPLPRVAGARSWRNFR